MEVRRRVSGRVAVRGVQGRGRRTLAGLSCAAVMGSAPAMAAQDERAVLYGVVDLSMAGISRQHEGTSLSLQSGVQSGSRWGLRGSEPLAGGMRAHYVLESGFLANTGWSAQGRRLFGRAAWVGLSGGFGEVRLGRQTSVSSLTLSEYDPFLASYLITGAQTTLLPFNANRADSVFAYWSPSVNGVRAAADYSSSYDSQGFATGDASKLMSAAVTFEQPGYRLAATVEKAVWGQGSAQRQAMRASGGDADPYAVTLAARADWDPVTLYAAGSLMRNGSTIPAVPSPGQDVNFPGSTVYGAMVGASWRVGRGMWLTSWQASLPQSDGALRRRGADHHQSVYSAGYTYDLSKRSNLYAIVGHMRGSWQTSAWKETQYAVGLRHRF